MMYLAIIFVFTVSALRAQNAETEIEGFIWNNDLAKGVYSMNCPE
jgi:hypothetical protein